MNNNFIKKAFTLAELFLSLFVMAGVAVFAVNSVFKKSNTPHEIKTSAETSFVCNKDQNYQEDINGCNFEITQDRIKPEFFEILLIGGGGGASKYNNGNNGEERVVYYPSLIQPFKGTYGECGPSACLECQEIDVCTKCSTGYKLIDGKCKINFYYRIVLGNGGKGGDKPQNGGQTSILIMTKNNPDDSPSASDKILDVMETAAGGLAGAKELLAVSETELSQNETSSGVNSGMGGMYPNQNGKYGEVQLKW